MDEKPEAKPMGQVIQIDEARIRDHLGEMVRGTVEEALNAMLDAEADRLCGAGRYERSEARKDMRAGHYERALETRAGQVSLKVPKLRRQTFETAIIERYRRRESSGSTIGAQRAAVAAQVVAEPGDTSETDLAFGSSAESWSSEATRSGRPRSLCTFRTVFSPLPRLNAPARSPAHTPPSRHQRHAAHVQRRRPRSARQRRRRPPEDLEVELRDPVAVGRQVEVLEHHIGGAAIGRRRRPRSPRSADRAAAPRSPDAAARSARPGRSPARPPRSGRSATPRPRRARPRGSPSSCTRAPSCRRRPCRPRSRGYRLQEPARPDDLPRHPHAPEDPRQRRALARAHDAEPLDPPGLHRRRPEPEQPLVDRRAERRARPPCRAPSSRARRTSPRARRRARSPPRTTAASPSPLLSGKRNTPAIRRAHAGVSGNSTTPCPE